MMGSKGKDWCLTGPFLRYCLLIGIIALSGACNRPDKVKISSGESFGKIIYDTYVINRDSSDSWGDECLSDFKRKELINKIFNAVSEGRITPYDYFTNEKIPVEKIREMEKIGEFSRKDISKIQFQEQWIWNDEKAEMQKLVLSMTIAYEVYDNTGKSRGQKPIFKLVFNQN